MIILDLVQGTEAWHDARAVCQTASEAPVMKGASPKVKRNELLHMKATGTAREVSAWVQKHLFDKGHAYEASARVILEKRLGEDLYPITATSDDGKLLASYDGMDLAETFGFEHKMWNESLAQAVRDQDLSPEYYWQLEQQILVGDLKKVIFVVSDGTADNWEQMDYYPVPGRAEQLLAGWKQFDEDLANYVHIEDPIAPVGIAPETLPALRIELTGMVTASNLKAFEGSALAVIGAVKTNLQTDQDFADAKKAVVWCGDVEKAVAEAKRQALSQTQSIDDLFKAMDRVSAFARETRLKVDKMVKAQELSIKVDIKQAAEKAFADHCATINARLGRVTLPPIAADFAGAMKGKRNLASIRDAVDSELARVKIEANAIAEVIDANLAILRELAPSHIGLFRDAQQIITKANDDFALLVKARISENDAEVKRLADKKVEDDRIEAERIAALPPVVVAPVVEPVSEPVAAQPEPSRPLGLVRPREQLTQPLKAASTRPSDDGILGVLALHYRVHESKVIEWIITMDMESASRRSLEAI